MPPELERKMALKETRRTLVDASNKGDFAAVVAIVDKAPALVDMSDLDVAWRTAEARGRIGQDDKALEINKSILSSTQDPAARLATVQKAMAVLKPDEVKSLLALGKTGTDGRSEFDAIETDLVRQRIGRILAGAGPDDVTAAEFERVAAAAKLPGAGIDDIALLGWLSGQRKDYAGAHDWFRLALAGSPDPAKASASAVKAAQGAAMALNALGRAREAEDLAFAWRDRDPAMTLLFLSLAEPELTRPTPVAIPEDRLQRFSQVALAQQSGGAAQALGWYAYNIGQPAAARAWFEKAMAWQPRDTTALGLALSMQRLGDAAGLKAFVEQNLPTYPTLASVIRPVSTGLPAPVQRGLAAPQTDAPAVGGRAVGTRSGARSGGGSMASAYQAKDYGRCLAIASRLEASGRLDSRSALQKGWCLMGLDRPQEAALAFTQARGTAATAEDAAYGEALARLRNGQSSEAAMAANGAALAPQKRNEIGVAVLAQRAAAAFDAGQYRSTLEILNQRRHLRRRAARSVCAARLVALSPGLSRGRAKGLRDARRAAFDQGHTDRPGRVLAAQGTAGGQMMRCRLLAVPLAAMLPLARRLRPVLRQPGQRSDGHRLRRRKRADDRPAAPGRARHRRQRDPQRLDGDADDRPAGRSDDTGPEPARGEDAADRPCRADHLRRGRGRDGEGDAGRSDGDRQQPQPQ